MKNNEAKSRMMLIDAYDFIERMECDTDLCAEMERDGLKALKKYLDLQPTAYDVDKVVEKLSCNECSGCELVDVCNGSMDEGFMERIREIVKAGGTHDA